MTAHESVVGRLMVRLEREGGAHALRRLVGTIRYRLELDEPDAQRYAATFTLTQQGESYLLRPAGLSDRSFDRIRERGVTRR